MHLLIVRMTTVALMLFCSAVLHHAPQQSHHDQPVTAAGVQASAPLPCAEALREAADPAHPAHPCAQAALPGQHITADVDLPLVAGGADDDDAPTTAATAADAAHPPGRHRGTVLSLTSVYRS